MNVPMTLPVWTEDKIRDILKKYSGDGTTEENADKIYEELKELVVGYWKSDERSIKCTSE